MAFAEVTGTVDYAKRGGKGFTVLERWEAQGKENKRKWHVWFEEPIQLAVGEPVKLRGILSAKVGEPWTDRDGNERPGGVELTLNRAEFSTRGEVTPAAPTQVNQPDPWIAAGQGAASHDDGSVPF